MGSGALVVTDGESARAEALARNISMEYWERRHELEADVISPKEAIGRGLSAEDGPVVLVETADCAGGGAAGDSVASLRALLAHEGVRDALVPVVDPEAAGAVTKPAWAPKSRCRSAIAWTRAGARRSK